MASGSKKKGKMSISEFKREVAATALNHEPGLLDRALIALHLKTPEAKQHSPEYYRHLQKAIDEQRAPIGAVLASTRHRAPKAAGNKRITTGIEGLDQLFANGMPEGSSVLICGGAGSGKTIMALQILNNMLSRGRQCVYISLEESEERLEQHMRDFNFDVDGHKEKDLLHIRRIDPFKLARLVEAMLANAKGELMFDFIEESLLLDQVKPSVVFLDSITALESAFEGKDTEYRIYIEQLFRYFERIGATSFLISETDQMPVKYSKTGVEEFLADGVLVLYHIQSGETRTRAIEILKMRGAKYREKLSYMEIVEKKGIRVLPDAELFMGESEMKK
ncbi:MAG: ATPase domain-containing protein [Candidatus Micrarchaeia archaeon]|jgi:circadian clock protein KaiC